MISKNSPSSHCYKSPENREKLGLILLQCCSNYSFVLHFLISLFLEMERRFLNTLPFFLVINSVNIEERAGKSVVRL